LRKADAGRLKQHVKLAKRNAERYGGGARLQVGFGQMLLEVTFGRFKPGRPHRLATAPPSLLRGAAGQRHEPAQVLRNGITEIGSKQRYLRSRGFERRPQKALS
jgi:hypothetical protein